LRLTGRGLVEGKAGGRLLVTGQQLSFLGGVDSDSGMVVDRNHELFGQKLKGVVLALPYTVGSSVGAYVIYNLTKKSIGPSAVVAVKGDITLVSGCALAGLPLADGFQLSQLKAHSGRRAVLDGGKGELVLD
jgi:predicted aconitase with swiveling domain